MIRAAVDEPENLRDVVIRLSENLHGVRGKLLPLLHALQEEIGYVPDAAAGFIAEALNMSRAEVFGVISFYPDFHRAPRAAHVVKICRAESCQARGAEAVQALASERLGVGMGETRADGMIAIEPVYCLGLCATGPNALVDGRPVSKLDAAKLDQIAREIAA
jgi:formate dehydrogenase subunit gamma